MLYVMLFLEGILTFISPCLLPMLPVYVSFFAAEQSGKSRTLSNAAGFVIGFTLVFVILGAFAGTFGRLLALYAAAVNIITGLVVIILGLNIMGVLSIHFLNRGRTAAANVKGLRFFSSILFGIVFSTAWSPCVSAFLGSALMKASAQGGALAGSLMLLVYSLGLGIPFMASAVLINRLKNAFDVIKRQYRIINTVSGILLIITGLLMATGLMGYFLSLIEF